MHWERLWRIPQLRSSQLAQAPRGWGLQGLRPAPPASPSPGRRAHVTSLMLISASTYCRPFCRMEMRAAGGTSVPLMLDWLMWLSIPNVNAEWEKPAETQGRWGGRGSMRPGFVGGTPGGSDAPNEDRAGGGDVVIRRLASRVGGPRDRWQTKVCLHEAAGRTAGLKNRKKESKKARKQRLSSTLLLFKKKTFWLPQFPDQGMNPCPPPPAADWELGSLNHWTAREVSPSPHPN